MPSRRPRSGGDDAGPSTSRRATRSSVAADTSSTAADFSLFLRPKGSTKLLLERDETPWMWLLVCPPTSQSWTDFRDEIFSQRDSICAALKHGIIQIEAEKKRGAIKDEVVLLFQGLMDSLGINFTWRYEQDRLVVDGKMHLEFKIRIVDPRHTDDDYFNTTWLPTFPPAASNVGAAERALQRAGDIDLRRWIVSFTGSCRAKTGLPDLAACLGAAAIPNYVPQNVEAQIRASLSPHSRTSRGDASTTVLDGVDNQRDALATLVVAVLKEAAVVFKANPTLDMRAWLAARLYDPAVPPFLPSINGSRMFVKFNLDTVECVLFESEEVMKDAIAAAMAIVRTHLYMRGRDWVSSTEGIAIMNRTWLAIQRPARGPTVQERRAEIMAGGGCTGSDCQEGQHLCGSVQATHSIDEPIACADMLGIICCDCRITAWARLVGFLPNQRARSTQRWLIGRDSEDSDAAALLYAELIKATKTIIPAAEFDDWPLQAVAAAMNGSDEDCLAFADTHPLLSREALQEQPTTVKKAPLAFELYRATSALTISVDQVHMYDDATPTSSGVRIPHTIDSCRLLPAAFQWRQSGHIGVTTLCLVAMSVNATTLPRKTLLLSKFQRLIHGLDRLEQAYRSTDPVMDASLVPLSAAAHALVAPTTTATALAPLAAAFASGPTQPAADVEKLIASYPSNHKSGLQELADNGDDAAKQLLKVFTKDRDAILAMEDAELKKEAKRFDGLVRRIEAEFNKDKPEVEKRFCPRNPTTHMPTGFLPTATTTKEMLLTALVAIERAVTVCDVRNFGREGTTGFKRGCYWISIPLLAVHWLRDGGDDPALGMSIDISGEKNVILRLAYWTHIDHLIPFFRGRVPKESEVVRFLDDDFTNVKISTRFTNELWTSARVSTVWTVMEAFKQCAGEVMERIQSFLGATKEEIDEVRSPSRPALSERQRGLFRLNGRECWEE